MSLKIEYTKHADNYYVFPVLTKFISSTQSL